jgi:hypothetical protein
MEIVNPMGSQCLTWCDAPCVATCISMCNWACQYTHNQQGDTNTLYINFFMSNFNIHTVAFP